MSVLSRSIPAGGGRRLGAKTPQVLFSREAKRFRQTPAKTVFPRVCFGRSSVSWEAAARVRHRDPRGSGSAVVMLSVALMGTIKGLGGSRHQLTRSQLQSEARPADNSAAT